IDMTSAVEVFEPDAGHGAKAGETGARPDLMKKADRVAGDQFGTGRSRHVHHAPAATARLKSRCAFPVSARDLRERLSTHQTSPIARTERPRMATLFAAA